LELFSIKYPLQMPLNCQLSFGYSRFLDLHIYNLLDVNNPESSYKVSHTLAYKENSSFNYTPSSSNIHPRYKHISVSTSLHRIHARCTLQEDIDHHLSFMHSILLFRNQDPTQIRMKTKKLFNKKKLKKNSSLVSTQFTFRTTTAIKFDAVSQRHEMMKKLIRRSFGSRLLVVYKSCGNIGPLIAPKRSVIKKLSSMLNK
jgi:hypothetical protein